MNAVHRPQLSIHYNTVHSGGLSGGGGAAKSRLFLCFPSGELQSFSAEMLNNGVGIAIKLIFASFNKDGSKRRSR